MDKNNYGPRIFEFRKLAWETGKKIKTEKNVNWKINEKLIVVWKIGVKFRS